MLANSTYYARKAAGVCPRCGLVPAAPGHWACARCLANDTTRKRQTRAQRKGAKLCARCGLDTPVRHHTECTACRSYHRQYMADRRQSEPAGDPG